MRGRDYKLVYYIGQEQGELYDLQKDPHELYNLWDNAAYRDVKTQMRLQLLEWLAASTYWNAGYRQTRNKRYTMRWPRKEDMGLSGPMLQGGDSERPFF